jgi:aerobic carbon-monoxide dehydrogenase medium subunit
LRPRAFDYFSASNLDEAVRLLGDREDARILAGGQSLVAMMKLRIVSPTALIDINSIHGLDFISEENGAIKIGALVRHDQIEQSPLIRTKLPLLAEAASLIGDQQIRNRGTIGGSMAHADPAADLPPAIVASRATLTIVGTNIQRIIKSDDFFRAGYTTNLANAEVIREVRIPILPIGTGTAYVKLAGKTGEWSVVNVAVSLRIDRGRCEDVSVVIGSVTSAPTHAVETEKILLGREIDDRMVDSAAAKALEGLESRYSGHPTPYQVHVTKTIVKRAILAARKRALGK